jgi:hypothetical protein
VIVLAVLLALALPASAGDQVPFKGQADDRITSAQPEPDGLHFTNAAMGQATLLGRFTRVGGGVIHADGTGEATLDWTAANGDHLFANVVGAAFISPTTIAGTYLFTGGTGRFENASGEADFVGITSDGIHFAVTFSGTLSSPGASQK